MSDVSETQEPIFGATREEIQEALFADLVARQTNLALMFLGQVKDPQTGQATVDLKAAQMFIDQLEMLAAKTSGNLSKPEEQFLKNSLTHLQLTFVKVSESPPPSAPSTAAASASSDADPKVKFSKKYSDE